LQHLDYDKQLEQKRDLVKNLLNFSDIMVFSDSDFYYRNRIDLVFHKTGLGLRKKGMWWCVLDIEECIICEERINKIINELRDYFKENDAFDIKRRIGTLRYAVIRVTRKEICINFILNSDSMKISEAIEKIKGFRTCANDITIGYVGRNSDLSVTDDYFVLKGRDNLEEEILGRGFIFNCQSFFQNNYNVAVKMHKYVSGLLKKYNGNLLDLYGGVGCFGVINSNGFSKILVVDESKNAIACARINIGDLKNMGVKLLDSKYLKRLELKGRWVVILDPPRSGMHFKVIEELNLLRPEAIIYVSCNVKQLARDLAKFNDYRIESAALFDMFPQTEHCEVAVELKLDN